MTNKIKHKKEDGAKNIALWSAVSFFAILIAFFWIINLKRTFEINKKNDKAQFPSPDFTQIKEDWGSSFKKIEENFDKIQISLEEQAQKKAEESRVNSAQTHTGQEIQKLKQKLEIQATSTQKLPLENNLEELKK